MLISLFLVQSCCGLLLIVSQTAILVLLKCWGLIYQLGYVHLFGGRFCNAGGRNTTDKCSFLCVAFKLRVLRNVYLNVKSFDYRLSLLFTVQLRNLKIKEWYEFTSCEIPRSWALYNHLMLRVQPSQAYISYLSRVLRSQIHKSWVNLSKCLGSTPSWTKLD